MKSIEIDSGGPVMPRSKSRATVRSLVSVGILEVAHARRTHARLGQPVVEPRRGAIAEVGADRLMDRREDLEQDEHDADERRAARRGSPPRCTAPTSTPIAIANTAGSTPRRTSTTHQRDGERAVGLRQDAEELPLVTLM